MIDLQSSNSSAGRIIRATGIVMGITVAAKLLGFVEKVILAYYFGTGIEVDAYLIAFSIPFTIFILSREVIEPAFLPTFMDCIKDGDEKAGWKLFRTVFNILFVLMIITTVIGIVGAPFLVSLFAPGFEGAKRALTVKLTRIVMPAAVFLGLSALTYITLNSYKRFTIPALGDLFFKGLAIGILVALYRIMGIAGLTIGVVAGALSRLAVHITGLWRKRGFYCFGFDLKYPPLKRMGRLMLPLILGIAFSQLSLIVDNIFASTLETGSVSSLAYAKKLVEMPVIVLPYALGIVIFPFFSELALSDEKKKLFEMLIHAVKLLAILFIPMAVGLIVLRGPVVSVLFERGAFDAHSTHLTASALLYYSLGLFGFAVEAILVQFYFSLSDTRTPIMVGICCVLLNILVTFILIKPLLHCGIALALTISKTVKVAVLYILVRRKLGEVNLKGLLPYLVKVMFAGVLMGCIIYFALRYLGDVHSAGLLRKALSLSALILFGIIIFIASALLMRVGEIKLYWGYLINNMARLGK